MRRRIPFMLLALALVLATVSPFAWGSSHREAPLISEDPVADNTDVYAFRSPDDTKTVTLIANYLPMEEPAGGPNFYRFGDDVLYKIHVFNNRDSVEDITFQFRFTTRRRTDDTFLYNTGPITSLDDPDWNVRQFYSVTMIKHIKRGRRTLHKAQVLAKNIPTPPCNIGPSSTPNYSALATEAVKSIPLGNGGNNVMKTFAGQRDDPFFVDLGSVFDLLTIRELPGNAGGGVDGVGGYNGQAIAIQVPIAKLTANGSEPTSAVDPKAVIGVYASAQRRSVRVLRFGGQRNVGTYRQVSRLAEPLINEVVIPLGQKDEWNSSDPRNDSQFLPFYRDPEVARLLTAIHGISVPSPPRNDIVAILLKGFSLEPLGIPFSNVGGPDNADLIRLNVAVEPKTPSDAGYSRLGILGGDLSGFPNGRRVSDDVVDIELQALAGATPFTPAFNVPPNNQLGDGVNVNDLPLQDVFPFEADPHQGFSHSHHRVEP